MVFLADRQTDRQTEGRTAGTHVAEEPLVSIQGILVVSHYSYSSMNRVHLL